MTIQLSQRIISYEKNGGLAIRPSLFHKKEDQGIFKQQFFLGSILI
jgi:hypothetical protein